MKIFIDSGNLKEIEIAGAARHHRWHHHQSVAAGEGRRRLPGHPEEDLPDREGADERRGRCHRRRGDDPRGARSRRDRRAHRRQGAVHARRRQGLQGAVVRGQAGQRHADLLADAGAVCRESRRDLRQPVRRAAGRHRDVRHGPHPGDRRDLRELPVPDRGARRLDPHPHAHRRGGADGRGHLHLPGGADRAAVQASADRHRPREVPEGLGEGPGGAGV